MKIDRVFMWVVVACTMLNAAGLAYDSWKPRPTTMSKQELSDTFIMAMAVIDLDRSDPGVNERYLQLCDVTGCKPDNVEAVLAQVRPLLRR